MTPAIEVSKKDEETIFEEDNEKTIFEIVTSILDTTFGNKQLNMKK
jgi:hypothetical protein